jgi:hypothetical protein
MANDTTNNPHILDTTGTIYDATKRVRIAGVVYVGSNGAGGNGGSGAQGVAWLEWFE